MTGGREGRVAVTMPQLGETVAEGTVLRWLKAVGDPVADQEPLLEIATDKVDAEVPSPAAGVLTEIVVGEDETVDVGTVLAHVAPGAPSTGQRAEAAGAPPAAPSAEERSPSTPTGERSCPATQPRHRHSPRVRRLAHDSGVDLTSLSGTGPGGRVTRGDVARAAGVGPGEGPSAGAAPETPAETATTAATTGIATAATTTGTAVRSVRTLVAEVDVTGTGWAVPSTEALGPGPDATAVVVAALAGALRAHPVLSAPGAGSARAGLAVTWSSGSGTSTSLVSGAADLNVGGVAQRLASGHTRDQTIPAAGFVVTFVQDADVLLEVGEPLPDHVATIVLGAPTDRAVVVDADGSPGIAVRRRSSVALSHDPTAVPREVALAFLREVVRRASPRA